MTHKGETPVKQCPFEDGDLTTPLCPKFIALSPDERAEAVKEKNLCFRCLRSGHRSRKRQSQKSCGIDGCQNKHHELVHQAKRVFGKSEIREHTNSSHWKRQAQVFLQVIPVVLHGPVKSLKTHAMLDLGSTSSLIQEDTTR